MAILFSGSSTLLLRHWTGQIPDPKGDKMTHSETVIPHLCVQTK